MSRCSTGRRKRELHTPYWGPAHRPGTFALRPQILSLGHAYLSSVPLVMAAQPVLDQVSAATHESCSLAIMDGDEILYVARSSSSKRIMSIDLGVGSRLAAHCTSMGRVLLANVPAEELAAYLRRVKLLPYTNRTIVSREKLAETLAGVRDAGYAIVDQELEIGLRSIAVPVRPGIALSPTVSPSFEAALSASSRGALSRDFDPPNRPRRFPLISLPIPFAAIGATAAAPAPAATPRMPDSPRPGSARWELPRRLDIRNC